MVQLYKAQQALVEAISGNPIRRTIVADTGTGKTAMAISIAQRMGARHILVLCPAIVRYHWAGEFAKWADRVDVGIIEMGRNRASGTKRQLLARDWAYAQNVQVVSYDLVKHVRPDNWDFIIIDELHNLGEPTSKQSRLAKLLAANNPNAHILGLSATPIPTDAKQVWFPQYLLHGSSTWGKPAPNGGVSWAFAHKYLEIIKNEYGTAIGGLRDDKKEALRAELAKVCSFISRTDISADLPALDVRPLYTSKIDRTFYADWLAALPEDIHHAVVLTYHIDEAKMVANAVRNRPVFYVDGSTTPSARHAILQQAEMSDNCVLVGTYSALSEGIRLMWAQKVLITETRASPGTITQLLGRFQSVGDSRRPQLEIGFDDDSDSHSGTLLQRIGDINNILRNNAIPSVVSEVFQPRPLTEERVTDMFASMIGSFNENKSDWENDENDID